MRTQTSVPQGGFDRNGQKCRIARYVIGPRAGSTPCPRVPAVLLHRARREYRELDLPRRVRDQDQCDSSAKFVNIPAVAHSSRRLRGTDTDRMTKRGSMPNSSPRRRIAAAYDGSSSPPPARGHSADDRQHYIERHKPWISPRNRRRRRSCSRSARRGQPVACRGLLQRAAKLVAGGRFLNLARTTGRPRSTHWRLDRYVRAGGERVDPTAVRALLTASGESLKQSGAPKVPQLRARARGRRARPVTRISSTISDRSPADRAHRGTQRGVRQALRLVVRRWRRRTVFAAYAGIARRAGGTLTVLVANLEPARCASGPLKNG